MNILNMASDTEYLDKILQKYFTTLLRSGYVQIDGVTMPRRFQDFHNDVLNWKVNEKDIWICSFPKSGTTWAQEMVWMIMNDCDFVGGQENLAIRSPFLELTGLLDYRKFMEENPDFQPPPFLVDSFGFVRGKSNNTEPLLIKTHLPWNLLPNELQKYIKKPKIIYVTRNPQDTCLSYYHHGRLIEGYTGNFEDYCNLFLAGKLNYAPYWNHVLPFWEKRNQPHVLFLTYEKMKQNLPSVIIEVADFLGKTLTTEQIDALINHLSFTSMKNNASLNYEDYLALHKHFKLLADVKGSFIRSGKVGEHKEVMSPEIMKKFEEWVKENTRNTDF